MVSISKTIASKIQEKQSDLTSDEVSRIVCLRFLLEYVVFSCFENIDSTFSIIFAQSWYR